MQFVTAVVPSGGGPGGAAVREKFKDVQVRVRVREGGMDDGEGGRGESERCG